MRSVQVLLPNDLQKNNLQSFGDFRIADERLWISNNTWLAPFFLFFFFFQSLFNDHWVVRGELYLIGFSLLEQVWRVESVQLKITERINEFQIIFHSNMYCLGDSVTSLRIAGHYQKQSTV